ncbi:MAG: four helix bundle protein [bacterium]|nr:four helix bundle protein [bacterium]
MNDMIFSHEKLDVYKTSLKFAMFVSSLTEDLKELNRHVRDQLIRAALSIELKIAEGNGKRGVPERKRFFQIARGSAMECAACLDLLVCFGACGHPKVTPGKQLLYRIVSMLSRMTEVADETVGDEMARYGEK